METTTKVKFGFKQLFNPTPEEAKLFFRGVLYFIAIVNLIIDTVTEIPEPIKATIRHYSIYAIAIVHAISRMFGIQIEEYRWK